MPGYPSLIIPPLNLVTLPASLFSNGIILFSLTQRPDLAGLWLLSVSSPPLPSIRHEVLSTLLFQCLFHHPFFCFHNDPLMFRPLLPPIYPDDSTMQLPSNRLSNSNLFVLQGNQVNLIYSLSCKNLNSFWFPTKKVQDHCLTCKTFLCFLNL